MEFKAFSEAWRSTPTVALDLMLNATPLHIFIETEAVIVMSRLSRNHYILSSNQNSVQILPHGCERERYTRAHNLRLYVTRTLIWQEIWNLILEKSDSGVCAGLKIVGGGAPLKIPTKKVPKP